MSETIFVVQLALKDDSKLLKSMVNSTALFVICVSTIQRVVSIYQHHHRDHLFTVSAALSETADSQLALHCQRPLNHIRT
jgi:hypothetical protein